MSKAWTHVRIPLMLKTELKAWGDRWREKMDAAQQGNHEHPTSERPPLWKVIQKLIELEEDHRERSKRSKRTKTKATEVPPRAEPWDVIGPMEPVCEE